mmetsp:Transcript_70669/g.199535  ORF Transcript_70669/g.199535 Transcript_70669/m.199535 type:complete len:277 (+) Transcript_70669:74-904(+)
MGLTEEGRGSWLWPFRQSPRPDKESSSGERPEPVCGSRAFDIADALEGGLARDDTTDIMLPLRKLSRLFKFHVKRSEDMRHYRLYCDDGEFIMYARLAPGGQRVDFSQYDPLDGGHAGLYDPERPAFRMTCNESRSEWRLVKERLDHCNCARKHVPCDCRGNMEVARIRQSTQDIGDGTGNEMEVELAAMDDEARGRRLVTKMPTWNDEVGSLVLDFKGRRVQASAKNFQLTQEGSEKHLVCQHCKIAPNTFSLDFRFPLSAVQAFAVSLTTLSWT